MGKMIGRNIPNILLFILYREGLPLRRQKGFKFYLRKVRHLSHVFEDSNMMQTLQYLSPFIIYALTWPD